MGLRIRQEQAEAFGPEPCAACEAAARAKKAAEAGKSVVVVDPTKKAWIGIELVDDDNKPLPNEYFRVVLRDGKSVEGRLDGRGRVRLEGVEPGDTRVSFPNRDANAWDRR